MKKKTPPLAAPAPLPEWGFVQRALGDTALTRLAWLLDFLGETPERWHPAVLAAHGQCLGMLAFFNSMPSPGRAGGVTWPRGLTPDEILGLHAELRATLDTLLSDNPTGYAKVSIPTDGVSESLVRTTRAGVKPAGFGVAYNLGNPRTAILQAVKTLILRAGDRLIACPACRTPFLAVHKMKFCSPRCAQRARNKRREDTRPRKTERKKGRG